jgi:hypothetical protein
MSKEFLHYTNIDPVLEEQGSHCVPQHVRGYMSFDSRLSAKLSNYVCDSLRGKPLSRRVEEERREKLRRWIAMLPMKYGSSPKAKAGCYEGRVIRLLAENACYIEPPKPHQLRNTGTTILWAISIWWR